MAEPVRSDDSDIQAMFGDLIAQVGAPTAELEASAKLQAMIDAARSELPELVDPRALAVRFTRLKAFALSPAHYLHACQDQVDETLALRMGSGVHSGLFLNRPVVCFDGRRQGKAWERFEKTMLERHAVILNEKEYRLAVGIVESVKRHPRAMEILFDGTTTELGIDWARGARKCRSTPDSFRNDGRWSSDLKSSRCTEPRWFARECLKRFYPSQLGFYDGAIETVVNKVPDEHYIVGVENVAPFNVTIMRLTDETRELGQRLVTTWWEQLTVAEASGQYPGYALADVPLEPPTFENNTPITVEFDGQLHTIG